MFTAEELEDCDIFPKKITFWGSFKFLLYFSFMLTAVLIILSLYTGRDIKYIISMDTLKYGQNSIFFQQLYFLDSKFNYNLQEKYDFDFLNFDENHFIREYVSQNIPCLIKNASINIPAYSSWTNETGKIHRLEKLFKEQEFEIEVKSDPFANYFYGNYKIEKLKYTDFIQKATNKDRLKNYFIANQNIPLSGYEDIMPDVYFNFTKHLNLKNIKFSEGFGENITPSHYDREEQLICQFSGTVDILIIPQLYRNTIYNFKKGYGPANYSPVNFFESEYGRFPKFAKAHRLLISLSKGDCLFIPAFWWYSVKTPNHDHYMYINLNYHTHSVMLENIIKNIEQEDF